MENHIVSQWEEIRSLVTILELDVYKNANGNNAAGVRIRRGLRSLRAIAASLVKETVELDKRRKGLM